MTAKLKPSWAGDDLLSRFVNTLIGIKPIFGLMKQQARNVLIKTAETNGVPWRENRRQLELAGVESLMTAIANPEISYPAYYQVPFHAYDEGNLCWQAAFEAESATYAMALRVWKDEALTWEAAHHRLRHNFYDVVWQYVEQPIADILDVGCSVGVSTHSLHRYCQTQQGQAPRTVGLDLSPHMLAVAKFQDQDHAIADWVHGLGESMPFGEDSFDLVSLQFVLHELPDQASKNIFQEIWRVLKPGGILAITDNNPRSTIIQNLPPVLFTLMKSTEPWSDQYYLFDVEGHLTAIGFEHLTTTPCDPRHRAIIARKPLKTNI